MGSGDILLITLRDLDTVLLRKRIRKDFYVTTFTCQRIKLVTEIPIIIIIHDLSFDGRVLFLFFCSS